MQHTGYSGYNTAANYPKVSLKTLCHNKLVYDNKKLVYRFDWWIRPCPTPSASLKTQVRRSPPHPSGT